MEEKRRNALREVGKLIEQIINAVITMIIIALPVLIRLACLLIGVFGVAAGLLPTWYAYGADVFAFFPAVVFCLSPMLYALVNRLSWGGVLAGGIAAYAIGQAMPLLPVEVRSFFVVSIIGAACVASLTYTGEMQHETQ